METSYEYRIKRLEQQMEQHLISSIDVFTNITRLKTDVQWIKWLVMGIAGGIGTIAFLIIKK